MVVLVMVIALFQEDIIRILPLFVLKSAYQNSVGLVFKKLLTGRSEYMWFKRFFLLFFLLIN